MSASYQQLSATCIHKGNCSVVHHIRGISSVSSYEQEHAHVWSNRFPDYLSCFCRVHRPNAPLGRFERSGGLQADRGQKSVQIVGDSLIEAVKLTAFVSKRTTGTASQSFFTSMEQALARLAVRKHTTALYLEMTD